MAQSKPPPPELPVAAMPGIGLLLTGGGARTAYQAGVLQAVAELQGSDHFPYRYISGSSAGSINAAYLAAHADKWPQAAADLCDVWGDIRAERVFSTEVLDWYLRGARWVSWLALPRLIRSQPDAILDNTPLISTLRELINPDRISANLDSGLLETLGIGASSYSTGRHVTFYQSRREGSQWQSADRVAIRQPITIQHLAASSAIPFVFPPVMLNTESGPEWFGDGTMRQSAPLLPLVEAGARRILAISVSPEERASMFAARQENRERPPTLAHVAGHALASVFYDALPAEIDQTERINGALALLQQELPESFPFQPIEVLAISPSEPIESVAIRHVRALPRRVRSFLRTFGATDATGMSLASYLLFEPAFTSELIAMGRQDAFGRRDEIFNLLRPDTEPEPPDASRLEAIRQSLSAFARRFRG
ncbi:MAG: patatin-like phospholipase family protein [Burkholderiaceae bacterium]